MWKLQFLVLWFFVCYLLPLAAQKSGEPVRMYRVWITTSEPNELIKGYLYAADSSSITISRENAFHHADLHTIQANEIDHLKIRRKGAVAKGLWIGALSGLAVGVVSGLASGDDDSSFISFTKEEKAVLNSLFTVPIGGGIGASIATKRIKLEINGDPQQFIGAYLFLKERVLKPTGTE